MAGLSTKAIKTRIKSMASTRQITKDDFVGVCCFWEGIQGNR